MRRRLLSILSGAGFLFGLATLATPASADFIKFYSGGAGYAGPFSTGAYTATTGLATDCPDANPGCDPGPDLFANPMGFQGNAVVATASGPLVGTYEVWNDLAPANTFAGLGVEEPNAGGASDHINGGDILTITFAQNVILDAVITLFSDTHDPFGPPASGFDTPAALAATNAITPLTFLLNGVSTTFDAANNIGGASLGLVGSVFTFQQEALNPSFYLSGLVFQTPNGFNPVPIPAALPLFGGGLALMGFFGWRRRRAASA